MGQDKKALHRLHGFMRQEEEGERSLKLVIILKSDIEVSQLNQHDLIKNSDCV